MKVCLLLCFYILLASPLFASVVKWRAAFERRTLLIQENYGLMVDLCVADRFQSKKYVEKAITQLKVSEENFTSFFIDDCVGDIEQGKFVPTKPLANDLIPQNENDPKVMALEVLRKRVSDNLNEIEKLNAEITQLEPRWIVPNPMKSCQETCQVYEMNASVALDLSFEGCRMSPDISIKPHERALDKGSQSDRLIDLVPYFYADLDKLLVDEMGLVKNSPKYEETENFLRTNFVCYYTSNVADVNYSGLIALQDAAKNLRQSLWLVKSCYCSYRKDFIKFRAISGQPLPLR
jgi:hypothetical protein